MIKQRLVSNALLLWGAINVQGRVVALLQRDLSIKTSDLVEFLRVMRTRMKRQKTYIFLDNLHVHHTHLVRDNAFKNNQVLIFNALYSNHLNPIERLLAVAKRPFIKDCVTYADFRISVF